jgi:periplasmic copper chaperone A
MKDSTGPDRTHDRLLFLFFFAIVLLINGCRTTGDEQLVVQDAWARPSPQGAPTAAFYFTIDNQTSRQDVLQQVRSDNCETVEVHLTQIDSEGVMRMAPVAGGQLTIAPGETVTLAPGGLHVMCIGPRSPLVQGEESTLVLDFENAGSLTIQVSIRQDES